MEINCMAKMHSKIRKGEKVYLKNTVRATSWALGESHNWTLPHLINRKSRWIKSKM